MRRAPRRRFPYVDNASLTDALPVRPADRTRSALPGCPRHGCPRLHAGGRARPRPADASLSRPMVLADRTSACVASTTVLQRALIGWMQDQLLHAPIEQFSHKDFVFRRTGDFVDPTELLELLT